MVNQPRQGPTSWLVAAIVGAALVTVPAVPAGADVPCPNGKTLVVVAHEDDDLLFINPDIRNDIQAGRCVRTLFVTAGDAGLPTSAGYWQAREAGAKAAYEQMIGSAGWTETDAGIPGDAIPIFTHVGNPKVSLAFMRLPDGYDGDGTSHYGNNSLENIWEGDDEDGLISSVNGLATYTRPELITTLTTLMTAYQPNRIRTQDHLGPFIGEDHSDHYSVGKFTHQAHLAYTTSHTFTAYLGYRTRFYPQNVSGTALTNKQNPFFAYDMHDSNTCTNTTNCVNTLYAKWLPKLYTVGATTNLARTATATALSQDVSTEQTANKVNDGILSGYGAGSHTGEWATVGGGADQWVQLTWPSARTVNRVVLYDRPNGADQILSARLEFSSGLPIDICTSSTGCVFDNEGLAKVVTFPARSTTSVRLYITSVSGSTGNVGLMELEVYNGAGP